MLRPPLADLVPFETVMWHLYFDLVIAIQRQKGALEQSHCQSAQSVIHDNCFCLWKMLEERLKAFSELIKTWRICYLHVILIM